MFVNKNGADLLKDGLLNNKLPVWVMLEYQGLTPKLGFTVTGDWDAFQKHHSTDTKFTAQASYFGLFGGGTNLQWQKIREELVKSGSIKIDVVTGEGFRQEDVDRYLQPVVKMLLDGIMEDFKPKEITPAVAEPAKASGRFFSAGFSRAEKDVQYRKTGKFAMDFSTRSLAVAPATWTAATLGVKGRKEKEHVTWVKNQLWQSAYLKMPDVPTSNELGISAVDVEAVAMAKGKQLGKKQMFSWKKDDPQWKNENGTASRPYMFFPLAGNGLKEADLKEAVFDITATYTQGRNPPAIPVGLVAKLRSAVPVVNGTTPVSGPWEGFQLVAVDAASLSFEKLDPGTKLTQLYFDATVDGKTVKRAFKPYNDNGKFVPPPPFVWLADKYTKKPLSRMSIEAEIDGRLQGPKNYSLELGQTTVVLDDRVWKK